MSTTARLAVGTLTTLTLLVGIFGASARATPLPEPILAAGTNLGCNLLTAHCINNLVFAPAKSPSADSSQILVSGGDTFSMHSEALASPVGPLASAKGQTLEERESEDGSIVAAAMAAAVADWAIVVTPIDAGLGQMTLVPVPLTLEANLFANAVGDSALAVAAVQWFFGSATACSASGGFEGICEGAGFPNENGVPIRASFSVRPTQVLFPLSVYAAGEGAGNSIFTASADPVISIADALIAGTDINFRDAFVLTVSPGVTQSLAPTGPQVPQPAPWLLLVVGLLAAVARAAPGSSRPVRR